MLPERYVSADIAGVLLIIVESTHLLRILCLHYRDIRYISVVASVAAYITWHGMTQVALVQQVLAMSLAETRSMYRSSLKNCFDIALLIVLRGLHCFP